jgi:aspartate-semialdehyde dehydrogenase
MSDRYDIAVVGATTLAGEAILELLAEREFPAGRVHALDRADLVGGSVNFGNRELDVEAGEDFDFSSVRIVFCAGDPDAAAVCARYAVEAGAVVIDASGRFRNDTTIPLIVADVNPQRLEDGRDIGIIATPSPLAVALSFVLKPIHEAVGIESIDIATYESVSGSGREALEELGQQTAALLNFRDPETKVYPKRIAFNLLPCVGELLDSGSTDAETQVANDVQRLLEAADMGFNITAVRVPLFYGCGAALHLHLRQAIAPDRVRTLLAGQAGVVVADEHSADNCPTPAVEAGGSSDVFVGRIRSGRGGHADLNLWIACDNIRAGIAMASVRIAECLIDGRI